LMVIDQFTKWLECYPLPKLDFSCCSEWQAIVSVKLGLPSSNKVLHSAFGAGTCITNNILSLDCLTVVL
jgi:hypothetical protein